MMKRCFREYQARRVCMALLLLVPSLAASQSQYDGIYFGTFQNLADSGEFALVVNGHNHALLAAYDSADGYGFSEEKVYIRADGSFQQLTRQGYRIEGQIAADSVFGHYTADGFVGDFSGQRATDQGPLAESAGYYAGLVSLVGTTATTEVESSTRLSMIVAANGDAFLLLDRAFANPAAMSPWVLSRDVTLPVEGQRGFAWPFDWGWDWDWDWGFDFNFPFLLPFDVDFHFNLPSFSFAWPWHHYFASFKTAGGMIQIAPDGFIETTLREGLVIQGRLDVVTSSGQGTLFQRHDATVWSGTWLLERQPIDDLHSRQRGQRLVDFDNDGRDDILWRHATTGENAVWLMDSSTINAELPLEPQHDLNWTLVAIDKFDGDQQLDLVWQHANSGELVVWFSAATAILPLQFDAGWQVVGSGDFFADTHTQLLLRHPITGENSLVVDLAGQAARVPLPSLPDKAWAIAAVANFDSDAYPDILWLNQATAELKIWQMQGQQLIQEQLIVLPTINALELTGVGDFDGDGIADLLHRDTASGSMVVNLIAEGSIKASVALAPSLDLAWQIEGIGDLDGDGTDDMLWRHSVSGENSLWRIASGQVISNEVVTSVADSHWMLQP